MSSPHRVTLTNAATQWCAEARLSADLFNHWVAEFSWHRAGSAQRPGYSQEVLFSERDARERMAVFVSARKRCGYVEQAR